MSDKEILKMELDQLKKEVSTPRSSVSHSPLSQFSFPSVVNNLSNISLYKASKILYFIQNILYNTSFIVQFRG